MQNLSFDFNFAPQYSQKLELEDFDFCCVYGWLEGVYGELEGV